MTVKTFVLLGPVEARCGSESVALGGVLNQALLAALLLDAGRVVPIRRLIDAMWADDPPSSARVQVQNRIGLLRRSLRAAQPRGALIATVGSGYRLLLDDWDLDLGRFDAAVDRAASLTGSGRPAEASQILDTALRLWRGPALDGLITPVLSAAAARIEERRLNALEQRIGLDLDLGRHAELVPELTDLAEEHPYHEGVRALLMLALYRSGRQAEALHAYQQARRLLVDQIGVEPGAGLQGLQLAMLRGDELPAAVGARPPATRRPALLGVLRGETAAYQGGRRRTAPTRCRVD